MIFPMVKLQHMLRGFICQHYFHVVYSNASNFHIFSAKGLYSRYAAHTQSSW